MAPNSLFFRKIISIDTRYKTHNQKLLVIIKVFQTCYHYLKSCKYEIFIFIDYHNLHQFINTKNLSSYQA